MEDEGEGDAEHEDVRGDVEDHLDDAVVCVSRALRVFDGDGPVLGKGVAEGEGVG